MTDGVGRTWSRGQGAGGGEEKRGSDRAMERGSEGAMERGSEGARERWSEGARERWSDGAMECSELRAQSSEEEATDAQSSGEEAQSAELSVANH